MLPNLSDKNLATLFVMSTQWVSRGLDNGTLNTRTLKVMKKYGDLTLIFLTKNT